MEEIEARVPEIPAAEGSPASNPGPSAQGGYARSERKSGSLFELCMTLLITVLIALFATTFVVQAYEIPSDSMNPTLLAGDHLLVNKFIFGGDGAWYEKLLPYREIRRGDLVVFKYRYEDHPDYIKRVIGVPGDHLRIVLGRVFINGKLLREPYAVHEGFNSDAGTDTFPPLDPYSMKVGLLPQWAAEIQDYIQDDELVIPANRYFVMGDNRDDSQDSRYWGFVDRSAVTGEPVLIYWSVNASEDDYTDDGVWDRIKDIGNTLIHLRSQTRWHRVMREVH